MKYEERFQRYLDGDADEHESVQIEEDLDKNGDIVILS